jgi:hypothetical protein
MPRDSVQCDALPDVDGFAEIHTRFIALEMTIFATGPRRKSMLGYVAEAQGREYQD